MKHVDRRQITGWIAVGFSTAITSFWAYWGISENFHEGWYFDSLLSNLGLMLVQYLSPMLIFLVVSLISLVWPRVGALLHLIFALFLAWFFEAFTNTITLFLLIPLIGLGLLYWFGRPQPRRLAISVAAGLPLLALIIFGAEPIYRVSERVDDGNLEARLVAGKGVELVWAPAGPGWPLEGADYEAAREACRYLTDDGLALAPTAQDIWRLPAVDEAVRSMTRHGRNSGGVWHGDSGEATYETKPDKESPLWNVHSQVIYWWTATEVDTENAYIIVYDGRVWPRAKRLAQGYLGFRCVKDASSQ